MNHTNASPFGETETGADAVEQASDAISLPTDVKDALLIKAKSIASYRPAVALLGSTGAGKSSLGSALFGREVFKVSDVRAGTRKVERKSTRLFGVEIDLLDFPGVGESKEYDDEYRELYKSWMPKIDVALWLIKIDNRALAADAEYLTNVVKPSGFPMDRLVFVISQADKADPIRGWNEAQGIPGEKQNAFIKDKAAHIRELFSVAPSQIIAISAEERYNLHALAERIIEACPNDAALNIARTLGKEYRTDEVKKGVLKKVLAALAEFYDDHHEKIHSFAVALVSALLDRRAKSK